MFLEKKIYGPLGGPNFQGTQGKPFKIEKVTWFDPLFFLKCPNLQNKEYFRKQTKSGALQGGLSPQSSPWVRLCLVNFIYNLFTWNVCMYNA